MPLSTLFALLNVATGAQLDVVLAELGALTTIACTIVGNDSLSLTPFPNTPSVSAYTTLQGYSGLAVSNNTGVVVASVGGLAQLNVYKDTTSGPVTLSASDIIAGNLIVLYYDPTLDSGAGGFHLGGPGAPGSGRLPPGGSVGQPLANSGPGIGVWQDSLTASDGNRLTLNGGNGSGAVRSGAVFLRTENDQGGGGSGDINIQPGAAGIGSGGQIVLTGAPGSATHLGGAIAISGGLDGGNGAGPITISGGSSTSAFNDAAPLNLKGGDATAGDTNGGDVILTPGNLHGAGRVGALKITNGTSLPGAGAGTLTNAPHAGVPDAWIEVFFNGTRGWFPWWHA